MVILVSTFSAKDQTFLRNQTIVNIKIVSPSGLGIRITYH